MPSKTSKPSRKPNPSWKAARGCSEEELRGLAVALAAELGPRDRVLLEGPMGAGKTTFARALLEALGVVQPPEGSPTFAIAHEYVSRRRGGVVHIDFYRLKSEAEIEEAGISAYFWERDAVTIAEWASLFPGFREAVLRSSPAKARNWEVSISFAGENARDVTIDVLA